MEDGTGAHQTDSAVESMGKTMASSRMVTVTLMTPELSNFGGNVHGGHVLRLVDQIAYACASAYSGHYCVTRSIDRVDFRVAVRVGHLLTLKAQVNLVGRTSMEVGVRAESRNLLTAEILHTNSCYLTMVAVDAQGRPTPVPPLLCQTDEDRRRRAEASRRRQRNRLLKQVEESEEHYVQLLEGLDVAILVVDADRGMIQDANHQARQLLGISEEELASYAVWEIHGEGERERAQDLWNRAVRTGHAREMLDHRALDGAPAGLEVTAWLLPLASRRVVQWILRPLDRRG